MGATASLVESRTQRRRRLAKASARGRFARFDPMVQLYVFARALDDLTTTVSLARPPGALDDGAA